MTEDQLEFSALLRRTIKQNPTWLHVAILAVHDGIKEALDESEHDRAEWEAIAVNAIHVRLFKNNKAWIAEKIEAMSGRTSLVWDKIIEGMRK